MKKKSQKGNVYFVNQGEHIGRFLVFLNFDKKMNSYCVLALPECDPMFISNQELEKYLSDEIVEFVEKLPRKILKETILEYNYRISSIND